MGYFQNFLGWFFVSNKFLLGIAHRIAKESVSQCYESPQPALSAAQSGTNHSDLTLVREEDCEPVRRPVRSYLCWLLSFPVHVHSQMMNSSTPALSLTDFLCVAMHRGLNLDQVSCPFYVFPGTGKPLCFRFAPVLIIFGWGSSIPTWRFVFSSDRREK